MTNIENKDINNNNGLMSFVDIVSILGVFVLSSLVVQVTLRTVIASGSITQEFGLFWSYLLSIGLTIAYGWWLYRKREGINPPLNFSLKKSSPILILWGIVFMVAVGIVLEPLLAIFSAERMALLNNLMGDGKSMWTILSLIVAAPILEEILFRGIIQSVSVRRYGALKGILLSALVFGAAHLSIPQQAINAFVIALILGYVYYRTGSLASSIVLHLTNNLIAYLFILAGYQNAMLKDFVTNNILYWVIYCLCVAISLYSFYHFYKAIKEVEPNQQPQQ